MRKVFTVLLIVLFLLSGNVTVYAVQTQEGTNIIGSWETAVYIDGELLVTRVNLDDEQVISIMLKDFMEFLDYEVGWNAEKRIITAQNGPEHITFFVDEHKCNKNGSMLYTANPVYIDYDKAYLPLSLISLVFGIETAAIDRAENNDRINGIELVTDTRTFYDIQESVDDGHQPWRLDPSETTREFIEENLGYEGEITETQINNETARVIFTKRDGGEINVDLYQPAKRGEGGIWAVESWYDENHRHWQARDLSKLPPIFHNDENIPDNIKETVREALVAEWTGTFGVYYEVLGFEARNVRYNFSDGLAEIRFRLTMVTRNFYKDPDTVDYIKEAKENGSINYERLYDEYNMASTGSFDLMVTLEILPDGEPDLETLLIFSNISLDGEEYIPVKADDYILAQGNKTYTGRSITFDYPGNWDIIVNQTEDMFFVSFSDSALNTKTVLVYSLGEAWLVDFNRTEDDYGFLADSYKDMVIDELSSITIDGYDAVKLVFTYVQPDAEYIMVQYEIVVGVASHSFNFSYPKTGGGEYESIIKSIMTSVVFT